MFDEVDQQNMIRILTALPDEVREDTVRKFNRYAAAMDAAGQDAEKIKKACALVLGSISRDHMRLLEAHYLGVKNG